MDIFLNMFVAVISGIIIGLERQWRKKIGGIRTTALVCLGACMFVTLSTLFSDDSSPTRIAAQVVSGVGFLAGGVIIRDGFSVSGINTAATLWCSAAVGSIIAAGFPLEGLFCAVIVMMVNIVLRTVSKQVDVFHVNRVQGELPDYYYLSVTCWSNDEIDVRTTILHILNQLSLDFHKITCTDEEDGKVTILIVVELKDNQPTIHSRVKNLVEKLSLEKSIIEVVQIGSEI